MCSSEAVSLSSLNGPGLGGPLLERHDLALKPLALLPPSLEHGFGPLRPRHPTRFNVSRRVWADSR